MLPAKALASSFPRSPLTPSRREVARKVYAERERERKREREREGERMRDRERQKERERE